MCGPSAALGLVGTGVSTALSISGAQKEADARNAQYAQEISDTMAYNQRVRDAVQRANISAGDQYTTLEQNRAYNAKALGQEGLKVVEKAREAQGSVNAQGMSSGFWGGGSLSDIVSQLRTKEAQAEYVTQDKMDDLEMNYTNKARGVFTEAEDRINQLVEKRMPRAPDTSGLGIKAMQSAVGGIGSLAKGLEGLNLGDLGV